jgi:hypothetical protein
MPGEFADPLVATHDLAVKNAQQAVRHRNGPFMELDRGGDPANMANGYFDAEGNWVATPAKGVLFFGAPGAPI